MKNLLDNLKKTYPAVVDEVVPGLLPVGGVQKVLQNLLRERIPVRDLVTILEVLGDYGGRTKDPDILTEYVRHALSRSICKLHQDDAGRIKALTLDPHLEDTLSGAIRKSGDASYVALEPREIQKILARTAEMVHASSRDGFSPVILCSPQVRLYFKRMTERALPSLAVLSYNEIEPSVHLESVGIVGVA
jgi:flagellar biosynthesis protein FlhA